jgi:hypothetical protein
MRDIRTIHDGESSILWVTRKKLNILEKERRKGRKKLVNYSLVLTLDLLNLGSIYRVAEL